MDKACLGNQKKKEKEVGRGNVWEKRKKKKRKKKKRRKRQRPDQKEKKKKKEKKEKRIGRSPCASPHGHSRHLPIKLFPLSFFPILE